MPSAEFRLHRACLVAAMILADYDFEMSQLKNFWPGMAAAVVLSWALVGYVFRRVTR